MSPKPANVAGTDRFTTRIGPSGVNYHGLTDQVRGRVFVLMTAGSSVPGERDSSIQEREGGYAVGKRVYRFVQVKGERFFGIEKVWVGEARMGISTVYIPICARYHTDTPSRVLRYVERDTN